MNEGLEVQVARAEAWGRFRGAALMRSMTHRHWKVLEGAAAGMSSAGAMSWRQQC